jgi:hypothetical protein
MIINLLFNLNISIMRNSYTFKKNGLILNTGRVLLVMLLLGFVSINGYGQRVVNVPTGTELSAVILGDTLANGDPVDPNTIYELEMNGLYPVAKELNLVVPRMLNIELYQEVPIGSGFDSLRLREHFHHCRSDLILFRDDSLSLAATSTNMLETKSAPRALFPDLRRLLHGLVLQLLNRDKLRLFSIAYRQERLGVIFQALLSVTTP